jgi:exopolysaccharide biosynthesis polyprenyl glycosylphosphotransferase
MRDAAALREADNRPGPQPAFVPPPRRKVATTRAVRRVLPLYDAAIAIVAFALSERLWAHWSPHTATDVVAVALLAPAAWLVVFQFFRTYSRAGVTPGEEIRRTLGATATASFAVAAIAVRTGVPASMSVISRLFVVAALAELGGRWAARSISAGSRRSGTDAVRTLVVGTNEEAQRLATTLAVGRLFEPVGFVGAANGAAAEAELPIVGRLHETEALLRSSDVGCVYIASSALSPQEIEAVARACRRTRTELHISTNLTGIHPSRLIVRSTAGLTALSVKPVRLSGPEAAVKRTFDILVGSALLVLSLPVLLAIVAAIRLTSRGPAFYTQTRITKDGRPFTMYKFRSMVVDPERVLQGTVIDLTQPFFKLENDPRLTRIGRVIRALSIDELPQLWNIVRGDMSLVGPRPLPAEQVAANPDFLAPRHEVRSGLTGLWQVSGRSDLDSEDALRIDRFYIENWSVGLDLWILYRTIGAVLARRGAV